MLSQLLLTLVLVVPSHPQIATSGSCGTFQPADGSCTVTNTGSEVTIGANRGGGTNASPRSPGRAAPVEESRTPVDRCGVSPLCRPSYSVELRRTPTLEDLVSFAPGPADLRDEPGGVGIVGMPVNFSVQAEPRTVTGELFDQPVTVYFEPAAFVFVHGDGSTRTSSHGGASWQRLGQAQFTATATSHAYPARGVYRPHAVVQYRAAVDFGDGWVPVEGVLEIPTSGTTLQIVEVHTALVDRTCLEHADGPAC